MCPTIKLSNEIYSRLEKYSEGFETPAQVIEKILDKYEGVSHKPSKQTSQKDLTKYVFKNITYGKGKLVLAVVKEYIKIQPDVTIEELLIAFPKELQVRGLGVFTEKNIAEEIFDRTGYKRYYINKDLIKLKKSIIAVCSQWGKTNIGNFLTQAKSLGFEISPLQN